MFLCYFHLLVPLYLHFKTRILVKSTEVTLSEIWSYLSFKISMPLKFNIYGIPEGKSTLFTIYFYLLRFTFYHLLFYLLLHAILRFTIYHLLFTTYFFTSYHLHFTIYHCESTFILYYFYLLPPSIQYLSSWFYYLPFPIFFYFFLLPSSI